jgi:preprotein translocase subunit YajC
MDFFISNAWAQAGPAARGPALFDFLPLILLVVIFYFLLIRPQMKKQKEHRKLVDALAKGDEAVTTGGLLGRVKDLGENFILMELAQGVEVKVQRHAISAVLPKGTMKTL